MARPPHDFDDHDEEMDRLAQQNRSDFNRLLGCIGMMGLIAAAVVLVIGYWATHNG